MNTIKEINVQTGVETEREMNADEFSQYKKDEAEHLTRQAIAQARVDAKIAAQAKLAALGLTVADLEALGL